MERGKRIQINPIDEAEIYADYSFKEEVDKMMLLGISEIQAGCYISNYHDDYICDTYNGGCKSKTECEATCNKLRIEESI